MQNETVSAYVHERLNLLYAFYTLDEDRSGRLDISEWTLLVSGGLGWLPEDAARLFRAIDLDGNGSVELSEFLFLADLKELSVENSRGNTIGNFRDACARLQTRLWLKLPEGARKKVLDPFREFVRGFLESECARYSYRFMC